MKQQGSVVCFLFALVLGLSSAFAVDNDNPIYTNDHQRFASYAFDGSQTSYNYKEMWRLVRELMTGARGKRVREYFKKVFADQLIISEELQQKYGLPPKMKSLTEQQVLLMLATHPGAWDLLNEIVRKVPNKDISADEAKKAVRQELVDKITAFIESEGVLKTLEKYPNPLIPFLLTRPRNDAGYRDLEFFVNHETADPNGKITPAVDIAQKIVDWLKLPSTRQIEGNTFDFDYEPIADALIAAHKAGKEVRWGIDAGNYEHRDEIKALVEKFRAAGFVIVDQVEENGLSERTVRARKRAREGKNCIYLVDAVGLNHQKMISINYDDPRTAKVIYSSANPTVSGMDPRGDLQGLKAKNPEDQKKSVANANHIARMKSYLAAQLTHHQMEMIFDQGLRGSEFPLSGTYKIFGPKPAKDGDLREFMLLTFAPAGGLGNIGRHVLAEAVNQFEGFHFISQFAASSVELEDEFFEKAKRLKKQGKELDIAGFMETPFAMREWSVFLKMAGLKRVEIEVRKDAEGKAVTEKVYVDDTEGRWWQEFGARGIHEIRKRLHVAPKPWGTIYRVETIDGQIAEVQGKLHHKVMGIVETALIDDAFMNSREALESVAIAADSFNFSAGAESNTEQLPVFVNSRVAIRALLSIFFAYQKWNAAKIHEEAERRTTAAKERIGKGITTGTIETDEILVLGQGVDANASVDVVSRTRLIEEAREATANRARAEAMAWDEFKEEVARRKSYVEGTDIEINSMLAMAERRIVRIDSFDWDDNIMFMPGEYGIRVFKVGTDEEIMLSTEEFAHQRMCIGKPCGISEYKYLEGYEIRTPEGGFPESQNSFKYFRPGLNGENWMLEAVQYNLTRVPVDQWHWMGPVFWDFIQMLMDKDNAKLTSIITARGHSKESMMATLRFLKNWFKNNADTLHYWLTQTNPHDHFNNSWADVLKEKNPTIYRKIMAKEPIRLYLPSRVSLHAVSNPLYGGDASSPSITKAKIQLGRLKLANDSLALRKEQDPRSLRGEKKLRNPEGGRGYDYYIPAKFSDDDAGNIQGMYEFLKPHVVSGKLSHSKVVLHYTGSAEYPEFMKHRMQVITPDGGLRPLSKAEVRDLREFMLLDAEAGGCISILRKGKKAKSKKSGTKKAA